MILLSAPCNALSYRRPCNPPHSPKPDGSSRSTPGPQAFFFFTFTCTPKPYFGNFQIVMNTVISNPVIF